MFKKIRPKPTEPGRPSQRPSQPSRSPRACAAAGRGPAAHLVVPDPRSETNSSTPPPQLPCPRRTSPPPRPAPPPSLLLLPSYLNGAPDPVSLKNRSPRASPLRHALAGVSGHHRRSTPSPCSTPPLPTDAAHSILTAVPHRAPRRPRRRRRPTGAAAPSASEPPPPSPSPPAATVAAVRLASHLARPSVIYG